MVTSALVESLRLERVEELLKYPGPCITILLPPDTQTETPRAWLKTFLTDAARQLTVRKIPESAAEELLGPLRGMTKSGELPQSASWDSVLFRAPGMFRQVHLSEPHAPGVTVAGCFHIRPLLDELNLPDEFYVLRLLPESVALLRCEGLRAEPVPLPRSVPHTREDAAALSHHARGALADQAVPLAPLADFYKSVDLGVTELLRGWGASLILAGAEEHTALYRELNSYPNLVPGSIRSVQNSNLVRCGSALLREAGRARQARALAQWKEKVPAARFLTDPEAILAAAFAGRVRKLHLDESTGRFGPFETGAYRSCGAEDLLNLAAVQTLLHGGEVCAVSADAMLDGAPAAAVLRS